MSFRIEELETFHTTMVRIPFFISEQPTLTLAVSHQSLLAAHTNFNRKVYYQGLTPINTFILYFETEVKVLLFKKQIDEKIKSILTQQNMFCHYCQDISEMVGILYQENHVYVSIPENKELCQLIDEVAKLVVYEGAGVEEGLIRTGIQILTFLQHGILCSQKLYYRWRVYSYLQGDGHKNYRLQPYRMITNGNIWHPPTILSNTGVGILNGGQRQYFWNMLKKISRRKYVIQQAMIFSIYHSTCAVEILSTIVLALLNNVNKDYICFFYLLSDILLNSSSLVYRELIATLLPDLTYKIINKSKQLQYLKNLKDLFTIWQKKFIFEDYYIKGLKFIIQFKNNKKIKTNIITHKNLLNIQSSQELKKICRMNGIPFLQSFEQESCMMLNEFFIQNEQILENIPKIGQYDGQQLNEKLIIKIKNRNIKSICCQNTNLSMLFKKNNQSIDEDDDK